MYRKYKSVFRNLSNSLYDTYIRWNGQSKGLDSYTQVIWWVYYWEYVAKEKADILICPPL